MSAFLCSEKHLAAVATWATVHHLTGDPLQLCMTLRRLNNAALAARYGDEPLALQDIGPALLQAWPEVATRTPAEALALLECLQYQCSEGDVMQAHRERGALLELVAAAKALAPAGKAAAGVWALD